MKKKTVVIDVRLHVHFAKEYSLSTSQLVLNTTPDEFFFFLSLTQFGTYGK